MRVLKFTPFSDAFELLHTGIVRSGMRLTTAQMRNAARMIDKLEAKGRYKPLPAELPEGTKEKDVIRAMENPKGCTIELEEAEYELAKQMIEQTPWLPHLSKRVIGLIDLLDATKEEKPAKAK